MFCPQCGQQQVSETVRYCSRCGFLLEAVSAVVIAGGQLPVHYVQAASRGLSPRSKGVRQGALLMLSTILIVPVLAIITTTMGIAPHIIIPLAAVFCFLGGLLRILYALLMEDANAPLDSSPAGHAPPIAPQLEARRPDMSAPTSLPAAQPAWRRPVNTGQIVTPPSVTESTTRLLNKEEPKRD